MRTLGSSFDPRSNNIDLIRLLAASLVLISHSWPLTGREIDPVTILTGGLVGGGTLAVLVFFTLSGFLVTKSALERPISDYVVSRTLRVVPGLFVASMFDVFVIGVLFTTIPISEYFVSPITREHALNFLVFPTQFDLPHVFYGTPYPHVNGSLWTLPIECFLYLCLPIVAAFGLLRPRFGWLPLGLFAAYAVYATTFLGVTDAQRGRWVFPTVQEYPLIQFGLFFLVGSFAYIYRDRVPLSGGLCAIALILLYGARNTIIAPLVFVGGLSYLTLCLAVGTPRIVSLRRLGDLSYGVYIFAWPVQKSVITLVPGIGPRTLTWIALPITLALAYLSWHCVEKQALHLRSRLRARRGVSLTAQSSAETAVTPGGVS